MLSNPVKDLGPSMLSDMQINNKRLNWLENNGIFNAVLFFPFNFFFRFEEQIKNLLKVKEMYFFFGQLEHFEGNEHFYRPPPPTHTL